VSGRDAATIASDLLETFRGYAEVRCDGDRHTILLRYGEVRIEVLPNRLAITAVADDDIRLSYVKMAIAEHLAAHPIAGTQKIEWQGVATATTSPPFFQTIEVFAWALVSPHMKRITFKGASFRSYARGGLHVRLLFPPAGRQPVWPSVSAEGRIVWPDGDDAIAARVYTIRRIDAEKGEIEIDFVLHETGSLPSPGADFGQNARPGDTIGIFAPGGDEIPKAASLVLLGDETALPAMARIVEDLPATSMARVFAKVGSPADHYDFPQFHNVELTYLYRGEEAVKLASLPGALEDSLDGWQGEMPFIWAGCEFNDYLAVRRFAREILNLPRDRHSVIAYWRDRRA
jgi:NADPH-dependent ferric siderophore reductase